MKIERADGVTPSEQYLKRLCDRAFLSLWSYSGVYRDQKQGGKGQGKELCDLLVVFDEHIIIFSDKYIEFHDSENAQVAWSRWYRKAVKESAEQIYGAERWIKAFPKRIFLDRDCARPFPIDFPNLDRAKFHRIIIAHGVAKSCKNYFDGGSGSLLLNNEIIGDNHVGDDCLPFSIGQVNTSKGYVHVFDDVTLDVILRTLDTVSDFVNYLEKKEKFLSGQIKVVVTGEEELLAFYLQRINKFGEHDFVLPKESLNAFSLDEGFWDDFIKSPERKSQLEADRISYSWDALIETFNHHILNGTQHYAYPTEVTQQEKIVRFLARENRTQRRMLIKSIYELLAKTPPDRHAVRVSTPTHAGDPYYVFLLLPRYEGQSEDDYREMRLDVLYTYCMVTKYKFPAAKDIIGFATESGRGEYGTEDLTYLDAREWTEESQEKAKEFHNKIGLLKTVNQFHMKELEYPTEKTRTRKRHKSKKR